MPRLFPPAYQFADRLGNPAAGGVASFFTNGTTTKKVIYSDADQTVEMANPQTLTDEGRLAADVFAVVDEVYTVRVVTASGELVFSRDDVTAPGTGAGGGGGSSYDDYAVDTGVSGTAYVVTLDPEEPLAAGATFWMKANTTSTGGATTVARNGGSPEGIKRSDGTNPIAGDIISGGVYELTYDGTNWYLGVTPMNINGLTTETTVDGTADFIAIHDTSAGAPRKTLFENISGVALGELKVKFVSDEPFTAAGPETCFGSGTTLIGTINRGTWLNGIYTATASTRLFVCATIHYQSLAAGGNILAEIMTDTGSPLAVGRSITYNDSGSARPADVVVAALVSLTNTQQVYIQFTPSANGTVESDEEFTNLNIIELG